MRAYRNREEVLGYYIRVLGKSGANVPLDILRARAAQAVVDIDESDGDGWRQLVLKHSSGQEIAAIERNDVRSGELGADELAEFIDGVQSCQPESAAQRLTSYLPDVKVIYAFQLLNGTDTDDGWTPLHRVYTAIWEIAGGILQADGEGFSNEEGYTILWQFGPNVSGAWSVGLLTETNRWVHFEIDLGNPRHREAFQRGTVPDGAKLL